MIIVEPEVGVCDVTVLGVAPVMSTVRSISVHYWPEVELFTIYFVMAMVLALRPRGLFMTAEPRKI